jgi:TolB-like protein
MKNFALIFVFLALVSCSSYRTKESNDVYNQASQTFNGKKVETNIAIVPVKAKGFEEEESMKEIVTNSLTSEFSSSLTKDYVVVERLDLSAMFDELSTQQTISPNALTKLEEMTGVNKIVVGFVSSIGSNVYLSLKLINLSTGRTELAVSNVMKTSFFDLLLERKPTMSRIVSDLVKTSAEEMSQKMNDSTKIRSK